MVRGTSVAIDGRGVLLRGTSGSGKSDLALRLIDRGAVLISDDYTEVRVRDGRLLARASATIAGKIELRGLGIVTLPAAVDVPLCLLVDLDRVPERLPDGPAPVEVAGTIIPAVALAALEASAPLKVEAALRLYGLNP
ncbi:MAG TPA: aldolase [Allosphingosinicella sp.]|nr:aldolase [Allosphingosinicella sp.]